MGFVRRRVLWCPLAAGALVLSGCAGVAAPPASGRRSAPAGSIIRSTSASATGSTPGTTTKATTSSLTPLPSCGPLGLRSGASLPPYQLGAISFLSPKVGVALTAQHITCLVALGQDKGYEAEEGLHRARLAVTRDGGRHWVTRGGTFAAAVQGPVREQVIATSVKDVWALSDRGALMATTDGGRTWAREALPAPVWRMAESGGRLWALACPPISASACRPVLERMDLPNGPWKALPIPKLVSGSAGPQLALASPSVAIVAVSRYADSAPELLATTTDAGEHWIMRRAPAGPGHMCTSDVTIATAGPRHWWLLCVGMGAAGQSTKAFLRTTDGGERWSTVSAVRSLVGPSPPGSLPSQEITSLAAGSPTCLWAVLENGLAESTNAGGTWSYVGHLNPDGGGSLDVASASQAWLLAPGRGLWRTTNGATWAPLGPLKGP